MIGATALREERGMDFDDARNLIRKSYLLLTLKQGPVTRDSMLAEVRKLAGERGEVMATAEEAFDRMVASGELEPSGEPEHEWVLNAPR